MASDVATVCLNIGAPERRQRLWFGVAALGVSAVLLAVLVATGQPRALRLVLILTWAFGALGVFQARERTCVALAAQGMREVDGVKEAVSADESEALRQQARKVYVEALGSALLLTALSLAL